MKRKKYSLLVIYLFAVFFCNAQIAGYHYRADISNIEQTGLYSLTLNPAITAHLKTDYSDLRIVNNAGKWVPHLLRIPNNERAQNAVQWLLPIIKKVNTSNFTELIVKCDSSNISSLVLKLKNTSAERYCTLTGSDDASNWYSINDSILIEPTNKLHENTAEFILTFSINNYKFYKLVINNKGKAPFNIMGIYVEGFSEVSVGSLHPSVENPATTIIQQDSGKYSFVKVTQSAAYHFDEIQLKISGVKYFYRNIDLYIPSSAKHSFGNPGQLLQSFTISNNSTLQYKLPIVNASLFYLIVSNEDNLPLKIESVKTFNSYHTVTAYFEKGNKYELIMGNVTAETPFYDLKQLHISPDTSFSEVSIGTISPIIQPSVIEQKSNSKWMLWLAIVMAGLVLSYFTFKLVKDMNKEKE